ncbi:MAG: alpha/beta hydrolase [Prochlorococcaceae cyanobacterium]
MLASLLAGVQAALPMAHAADQLQLRLDGLSLPVDLKQLEAWTANPAGRHGDLNTWLELLEGRSRDDLRRLLSAPLLRDRSFGQQLLNSWAGERVLDEVGELLTTGDGRPSGPLLLATLRQLMQQQAQVTTIELLRAVPAPTLAVQLDALVELAGQWRQQLARQQLALQRLQELPLARQRASSVPATNSAASPRSVLLRVAHRPEPLSLSLWPARGPAHSSWVLLMPGLGGSPQQLAWLADDLAGRGWPVLVLSHPGSDEQAVRYLLDGQRPPPGAEVLPDRLADVQAVLAAERQGLLPPLGDGVVLMGHSLGGLTALLASGVRPQRGLEQRCGLALAGIPLTNLSQVLQCQLSGVALPQHLPGEGVKAVVAFNVFGSLLWPQRSLARLEVPVLLLAGSLDLVTPPLSEQLELFLPQRNPNSRLVLVEGASHFSVVRLPDTQQAIFRLGEEFVGVAPERAQALIAGLTADFLSALERPGGLLPQRRLQQGITAHVLDRAAAQRWRRGLGGSP